MSDFGSHPLPKLGPTQTFNWVRPKVPRGSYSTSALGETQNRKRVGASGVGEKVERRGGGGGREKRDEVEVDNGRAALPPILYRACPHARQGNSKCCDAGREARPVRGRGGDEVARPLSVPAAPSPRGSVIKCRYHAGREGTPGTREETGSEADTSTVHLHLISHFSLSFLLLITPYGGWRTLRASQIRGREGHLRGEREGNALPSDHKRRHRASWSQVRKSQPRPS